MTCDKLDPFVTPYIDGELDPSERATVDAHLRVCPPCHSRVGAERVVRGMLQGRQAALKKDCAPAALRARCTPARPAGSTAPPRTSFAGRPMWFRSGGVRRLQPIALAASLVLVVG